eukprot:TRINITY_DN16831_c0_g1_i1.p1 TRINITY_DN16831_c0_g1~~TRINITY_DN16831_c0_g1_i1.p1  ORF type:complete len:495 (-),score=110.30 TRINITY_DN16831_c0_g1_i1:141-1427(-)
MDARDAVRVIVGGGDGTVMWVITELVSHGIDVGRVALGVIPFGTGNDFSRTLGWGGYPPSQLIGEEFCALRQHVRRWIDADVIPYDIWRVTVTTHEQGSFLFWNDTKQEKGLTDGQRKQHNITDLPGGGQQMVKPLCNYYSLGYDPQAGLGFDKARTRSQFLNLVVYAVEGAKKQLPGRKPPRLDETLDSIGEVQGDAALRLADSSTKLPVKRSEQRIIASVGQQEGAQASLSGRPVELIALNIPSFAKGCDLWGTSSYVGLTAPDGGPYDQGERERLMRLKQDVGDGNLSMLTYRKILGFNSDVIKGQMGLKSLSGNGHRIYQGPSTVALTFKDPEKATYKKDGRVYMEIDGEFFVCRYPSQVLLQHSMKLQVLRCNEPKVGCCACGGGGEPDTRLRERGGSLKHEVGKDRPTGCSERSLQRIMSKE